MCTKLPEIFASGTRGVGRPGSMPYSSPQGGLAKGGSFSATNHVLPIPGGLARGGSFSATNHVLPIPEGGLAKGGVVFSYKPCTPDSGWKSPSHGP